MQSRLVLGALSLLACWLLAAATEVAAPTAARAAAPHLSLARLPLSFEPNRGQFMRGVTFASRGTSTSLAVSRTRISLRFPGRDAVALEFPRRAKRVTGAGMLPGRTNYLLGSDPRRWRRNVPTYRRVALHEVAPGSDLILYGNGSRLEYDVVVRPGADPGGLVFTSTGARGLSIARDGD